MGNYAVTYWLDDLVKSLMVVDVRPADQLLVSKTLRDDGHGILDSKGSQHALVYYCRQFIVNTRD